MRMTLCENMRAVPYVPFYLALAGGYWESEGLDIRHVVSPSTARTATSLLDGSAQDVVLLCRIDTPIEVDYFRHGGILPFVLRELLAA